MGRHMRAHCIGVTLLVVLVASAAAEGDETANLADISEDESRVFSENMEVKMHQVEEMDVSADSRDEKQVEELMESNSKKGRLVDAFSIHLGNSLNIDPGSNHKTTETKATKKADEKMVTKLKKKSSKMLTNELLARKQRPKKR